jgi:hypothetical protein
MANIRLTVQPLSRNDIVELANLFELSFDYYIKNNSPFLIDYLRSLRTLVGLGFTATAALGNKALLCIYQRYLDDFMRHKEGNFKESEGAKTLIAQSVAELVATAILSFNALNYPRYYEEFMLALQYTMAIIPHFTDKSSEAERILSYLTVNRW